MARRSLRPQHNQIRDWVRQGRTDAWIAHQLEVTASELREFRRQHGLSPDDEAESGPDVDLRDEIEAEIEAAAAEEEAARAKAEAEAAEKAAEEAERDAEADEEDAGSEETETDGSEAEGRPRRRRRGRRGRRSRGSANKLEGTFDHGEEGYGLWLDPAIQDVAVYKENWAGERDITVTVEADQIVIRRSGDSETSED